MRGQASGWRGVAGLLLLSLGAAAQGPAPAGVKNTEAKPATKSGAAKADRGPKRVPYMAGVNFTAERGANYGSAAAMAMLERLPAAGVDTIALVPFGFLRGLREGKREIAIVIPSGQRTMESEEGMLQMARRARELGLQVVLKPHVWPPLAQQKDLGARVDRAHWLRQYEAFAVHHAKLAKAMGAAMFCFGTELAPFTEDEQTFRRIIAAVRKEYAGPVTYAANFGAEFEQIRFWDALDAMGLDNYYPMPDSFELREQVQQLRKLSQRYRRPVVFTEAGCPSRPGGHREPWADSGTTAPANVNAAAGSEPVDLQEQVRCYAALRQAYAKAEWVKGVLWWKVGTNGFGGPKHPGLTPWGKPAMEQVRGWRGAAGARR